MQLRKIEVNRNYNGGLLLENKNLYFSDKVLFMLLTIYITTVYIWADSTKMVLFSNLCFFIFAYCEIIFMLKYNPVLYIHEYILFYIILFFYTFISIFWAVDKSAVFNDVKKMMLFILAMVFIYNYFYRINNLKVYIKCLFNAGIFMCIYIILYYGPSYYFTAIMNGERIGGEIAQLNSLGMYAANTGIITLYYAMLEKKRWCYGILVLPIIVMVGSGSRKALIVLIVGCSLIYLLEPKLRSNILNKLARLLIIIAIIGLFISIASKLQFFNGINNRMQELFKFTQEKKLDYSRFVMLSYGWKSFCSHPILGLGSGNSHLVTLEAIGQKTYLHNNYIEMLVNGGIIEFLIYYAMYVYIIKNLTSLNFKRNNLIVIVLVLILAQLVGDIGVTSYTNKMTYIYLTLGFLTVRTYKNKYFIKRTRGVNHENQGLY